MNMDADNPNRNRSAFTMVLAGAAIGLLSAFSPGAIVSLLAAAFIILVIKRTLDVDERSFIAKLFLTGLLVRIILVLVVQAILINNGSWVSQLGDSATRLFGDDAYYTLRSWWMAKSYLDESTSEAIKQAAFNPEGVTGYIYIVSLFYYVFGLSPISWIFINCIFSTMTGIFYYFIAKEVADVKAAKITGILVVFFPSIIIWSIVNLKDSLFIFFTALILWAFIKLINLDKLRFLVILFIAFTMQFFIRPNLIYVTIVTVFALGFCYLLVKRKLKMMSILILTAILLCSFPLFRNGVGYLKARIISYHAGVIGTNGFNYRLYEDWVYKTYTDVREIGVIEVVKVVPKALAHFFLEPFPWKICSLLSRAALPQMVAWYIFLMFSCIGALIQLGKDWRKNMIFPLYFISVGTILALAGGNIGTNFRIRDMLTPIALLFSAIAISAILSYRLKIENNRSAQ